MVIAKRGQLHHSPQEAGERGDRGVHGDANVGHGQTEHQEIAGGPQLAHLEESHDGHGVEKDAQQTFMVTGSERELNKKQTKTKNKKQKHE